MSKQVTFSTLKELRWSSIDAPYGDLLNLTKMQARRLSPIGKKIIDMCMSCTNDLSVDFIVYASRHGELNTSVKLIEMIHDEEIPSPMKFSQSTHNSVIGQFCIQRKKKVPVSAISAGSDSFSMGLLSACNYLLSFPEKNVLLVFADAELPRAYAKKVNEGRMEMVHCSILTSGADYSINMNNGESDFHA